MREAANKLTFRVAVKANKIEIRKAIEDIFKVKVLGVNTIHFKGKKKKMGKTHGGASRLEEGGRHPGPGREDRRFRRLITWDAGVSA